MVNTNKHSLPLGGSYSGRETVNQKKSTISASMKDNSKVVEEWHRENLDHSARSRIFHKEVVTKPRCNGGVGIKLITQCEETWQE